MQISVYGSGHYPMAPTPDRYPIGYPPAVDNFDDRFFGYKPSTTSLDLEEATRPRSLGQGAVRVYGRQAELTCHFPASLNIVSASSIVFLICITDFLLN